MLREANWNRNVYDYTSIGTTPSSVNYYNERASRKKRWWCLSFSGVLSFLVVVSRRRIRSLSLSLSLSQTHEIERSPQRRRRERASSSPNNARSSFTHRVVVSPVIASDLSYTTSRGPRRLGTARRYRCFAPNTSRRVPSVLHTGWPARRSHSR